MKVVHNVQEDDRKNYMRCCDDIFKNGPANAVLLASDAHFNLSGYVNEKNVCYWAEKKTLPGLHILMYCLRSIYLPTDLTSC